MAVDAPVAPMARSVGVVPMTGPLRSWLLALMLGLAILWTKEEIRQFEAIPIGKQGVVILRAGDGCNTCAYSVERVSETEIRLFPSGGCTAASCPPPPVKFK